MFPSKIAAIIFVLMHAVVIELLFLGELSIELE